MFHINYNTSSLNDELLGRVMALKRLIGTNRKPYLDESVHWLMFGRRRPRHMRHLLFNMCEKATRNRFEKIKYKNGLAAALAKCMEPATK